MNGRKPKVEVPVGATDTHMHIYNTDVPSAAGGPPLPGNFREDEYRALQQRLGLSRVIVVQPNAYQDDTGDAAAFGAGPRARRVVVSRAYPC